MTLEDTTVINFIAGPGVGKSSIAAATFSWLKEKHQSVEMSSEFAKDLVWTNNTVGLRDQFYVNGYQHHSIYRLIGKVKYIVTDCPLLITIPYMWYDSNLSKYTSNQRIKELIEQLTVEIHKQHNSINFFLEKDRTLGYDTNGRNETNEESNAIQTALHDLIKKHNIENVYYTQTKNALALVKEVLSQDMS